MGSWRVRHNWVIFTSHQTKNLLHGKKENHQEAGKDTYWTGDVNNVSDKDSIFKIYKNLIQFNIKPKEKKQTIQLKLNKGTS